MTDQPDVAAPATGAKWHRSTFLAGRSYFPLGNGRLSAFVQHDNTGGGDPVTLLLQHPDTFSFDHRLKEWSLLYDPDSGLESTALTVCHDGHCHRAVTSNTTVEWVGEGGCPVVRARWWAGPISVVETFAVHPQEAVLLRRVEVANTATTPLQVTMEARLLPNRRLAAAAPRCDGAIGLCDIDGLTVGIAGRPSPGSRVEARVRSGEVIVAVDTGEVAAGSRCSVDLLYALGENPEAVGATMRSTPVGAVLLDEVARRWAGLTAIRCDHSALGHLADSAIRGLAMCASHRGRVNAVIWQYGGEWVRDSALNALGMLHAGLHDQANVVLERCLAALVDDQGRTQIHHEMVTRPEEQFDQAGTLLYVLAQHLLWTGDRSLVSAYWGRVVALGRRLMETLVDCENLGLLYNSREFWERGSLFGIADGVELVYQMWAAMGLRALPTLAVAAGAEGDMEATRNWARAGERLWSTTLQHPTLALVHEGRLMKRRNVDGTRAYTLRSKTAFPEMPLGNERESLLEPDTCTVLPIIYDMVPADGPLAAATLAYMEGLWNARWDGGGYDRYHPSSSPDSPGPWPLATMFVIRAAHRAGNWGCSLRGIDWMAATHGGRSGAWHESNPTTEVNRIQGCGINPWVWAEIAMFVVRDVCGVEPTETGVRVTPRVPEQVGSISARLVLRGHRLELRARVGDPTASVVVDGGPERTVRSGEILAITR